MAGDPMLREHIGDEELGKFGCVDFVVGWNKDRLFREAVYHYQDRSEGQRWWKLFDEVH